MNRLPVIERTYDFVKWLVPAVAQFPRQQRYMLGERLELAALDLLDLLVEARLAPEARLAAQRPGSRRQQEEWAGVLSLVPFAPTTLFDMDPRESCLLGE